MPKYYTDSPVEISQYEEEFSALLNIYYFIVAKNVLEIGTHYGGTLYNWLKQGNFDTKVVAIDDHHLNSHMYSDWTRSQQEVVAIKGKSQDKNIINEAWNHGPYDFIFIDGGHSYKEVKEDWENYKEMLTTEDKNKAIVFHDILPHPNSEVYKVWEEIKSQNYRTIDIISEPGQDGCGIGVICL